jgi:uncharacterized protein (TIGR00251 family)
MKLTESKEGVVVEFFVKPKSRQFEVTIEDDQIVIRCTEEPVKGRVNKEIIKELTKTFHTKIELVSGATSREKRILIRGIKKSEAERWLESKDSQKSATHSNPSKH